MAWMTAGRCVLVAAKCAMAGPAVSASAVWTGDKAANHEVTALKFESEWPGFGIVRTKSRRRGLPALLRLVLSPFIPMLKHVAKLDDMRMQPVGEPP